MPEPLPYPEPALNNGRTGLRRWRESDTDCIRLASTDPAIPSRTSVPPAFTPDEGLAFIRRQLARAENREGVSQAIVANEVDRAVGLIWVALRPQQHIAGLGYWVVPPERGKGIATDAVQLVVPWALKALDLQRLEAWVEPDNVASRAVLRGAGFQQEGCLRNFLTIDGRPSDALVFSVVPSD